MKLLSYKNFFHNADWKGYLLHIGRLKSRMKELKEQVLMRAKYVGMFCFGQNYNIRSILAS